MPGTFSLPWPSSPATNDAPVSLPIRANFQALQSQINNADGAALQSKTVTEQALADAINPRLVRTEMNMYFVASGLAGGFSGLTASLTAGVAYVAGVRVNSLGYSTTVAINQDTYLDMDQNGNVTPSGVANNAAAPSLAAGSIRLAVYIANGTAIVQVLQNVLAAPVAPRTANWTGADSLGNIVYPTGWASSKFLVNPCKFSVHRAASQPAYLTTANTFYKILFDTEDHDTGSNYDNATNFRFTAPVAGFYNFKTMVTINNGSTTGNHTVAFLKNGTTVRSKPLEIAVSGMLGDVPNSFDVDLQLAANDYIEVWAAYGGASGIGVDGDSAGVARTWFTGRLVSVN